LSRSRTRAKAPQKRSNTIVGDGKTSKNIGFKESVRISLIFSIILWVVIYRFFIVTIRVCIKLNINGFNEGFSAFFSSGSNLFNLILSELLKPPFLAFGLNALLYSGMVAFFIFVLLSEYAVTKNKHPYKGVEQGSARFGTKADIDNFIALPPKGKPYFYNRKNVILTRTEGISLDRKEVAGPAYYRTANILVIGGTGSGKTRFFVTPNVMQMHSSYVITDPKGELLRNTGDLLQHNGYDVRVFNLNEPLKSSVRYNPFRYIRKEDDILNLIQTIIKSTTPPRSSQTDPFWEKAETALLMALFAYVHYYLPPTDQHIGSVLSMLTKLKGGDDFSGGDETEIDRLFAELPDGSFAKKNFDIFRLAAGKTRSSILVSAGVRLAPWNIQSIQWLMREDTIDLAGVGEKKVALFLIVPDSKTDYNFIAAMVYTQLFATLYYVADYKYHGELPVHVRFMLDEFPNIGRIPDFEVYLATMRSRNISASIIIQSLSQLKGMYADKGQEGWEVIPGNCDSILFLGGQEEGTLKYLSERMGKTTITQDDRSLTRGKNGSTSTSFKQEARSLMNPDELAVMPNDECVLSIRGVYPFKSKKFMIEEHPDYNKLAEVSKKQFNMEIIPNFRYRNFFGLESFKSGEEKQEERRGEKVYATELH